MDICGVKGCVGTLVLMRDDDGIVTGEECPVCGAKWWDTLPGVMPREDEWWEVDDDLPTTEEVA